MFQREKERGVRCRRQVSPGADTSHRAFLSPEREGKRAFCVGGRRAAPGGRPQKASFSPSPSFPRDEPERSPLKGQARGQCKKIRVAEYWNWSSLVGERVGTNMLAVLI